MTTPATPDNSTIQGIAAQIFNPNAFAGGIDGNSMGFSSVGAFKLTKMISALQEFESLVASDIAVFAACPSQVSIGLMLQLQLQINKMVQFSEQISGLLSNLHAIIANSISNTRAS